MKEDSVRMRVVAPALVMSLLMLGVAGCTPFRPGLPSESVPPAVGAPAARPFTSM